MADSVVRFFSTYFSVFNNKEDYPFIENSNRAITLVRLFQEPYPSQQKQGDLPIPYGAKVIVSTGVD